MMTDDELRAFDLRMWTSMVESLRALSLDNLIGAHDSMVDKYEEAAGSDDEAAASFALSALAEAIRQKEIAGRMN